MKLFFTLFLLSALEVNGEVSRSPAVVGGICDIEIETTKIQRGSEKVFTQTITHQVIVRSDNGAGCSVLPNKRYADSVYEENARNEIKILFQKYAVNYSQKCTEYFKHMGLKNGEFVCDSPEIGSITFSDYGCEKKVEDGTHKLSYASTTNAQITYKQLGKKIEEKAVGVVQKEQCARVKECMQQASEKEMPELKKLSAVACNAELSPVSTARAPAVEKDDSFDGNRKPKTNSNTNKDEPQKDSEEAGSVLK